jgi:hypothetical protein
VGVAARTSARPVKFGLAALVAAALLYGAVVLLSIGPAFTASDLGNADKTQTVVRISPSVQAALGPAQKRPQASPGPARGHVRRGATSRSRATPTAGLQATASITSTRTAPPHRGVASQSTPGPRSSDPPPLPSSLPPLPVPVPPLPEADIPPLPLPDLPVGVPDLPPPPPLPLP